MAKAIKLEDGKYEILQQDDGTMTALRYGTPWRDLTGDKLILALVHLVDDLESTKETAHIATGGF